MIGLKKVTICQLNGKVSLMVKSSPTEVLKRDCSGNEVMPYIYLLTFPNFLPKQTTYMTNCLKQIVSKGYTYLFFWDKSRPEPI